MAETQNKRLELDELAVLRDLGASPAFLTVARRDPETIGERRNSAREAARQALRACEDPGDLTREELEGRGGHYFGALLDGEIAEAWFRADITNTRILLDTFGRDYLIERIIAEDGREPEAAARHVDERVDEYGDGILP